MYRWNPLKGVSLGQNSIGQSDIRTWQTWDAAVMKTPCFKLLDRLYAKQNIFR